MGNYDFERVPLWSKDSPRFEILVDSSSGRIPVTRVESWKDFSSLLESEFFNPANTQLVYRGQRRFDWDLQSTLARIPASGIIDEELAEKQLEYFRRAVRGRISDNALIEEPDELWSVGQHYGLNTPLLDWTYSPYVALFFAFLREDSEHEEENPYRAVYVLNKTFVADDDLCPDIRMFEPKKDDHGRLVSQAGLFTFSPYGSTIEIKLADALSDENFYDGQLRNASEDEQASILAKYICKIYIKNEDREGCMRHLRRMNVHHASLFPDLIGASEYCNLLVAEERRAYEFEQAEARSSTSSSESSIMGSSRNDISEVNEDEVFGFAYILSQYAGSEVESGRIQFVAEHLVKEIAPLRVIDWYKRDSAEASIRSKIRIALRKYGFPASNRDSVVHDLVEHLRKDELERADSTNFKGER